MKSALLILTPFLCLTVSACETTKPAQLCNYEELGKSAILNKYPFWDTSKIPKLVDLGATIKMYYPIPKTSLGGGPVAIIDKKSCKIKDIYATQ